MKWIFLVSFLILIFIPFAEKRINDIQSTLEKTRLRIQKLEERRSVLRHLENLLKERRPFLEKVEPLVLSDPDLAPVVARDLIKKILKSIDLKGSIEVSYPVESQYFPEPLGVMETDVEIGLDDYSSYMELLKFLGNLTETPIYIEEVSIGSNGINTGVKGKIIIRAKFFFLPGG
jgi:hypothetical protein